MEGRQQLRFDFVKLIDNPLFVIFAKIHSHTFVISPGRALNPPAPEVGADRKARADRREED